MVGGILAVIGVIYIIYQLVKDASIKPAPKGTDFRQIVIDSSHISKKELNRRIDSGYYVKKEEKK